MWHAAQKPTTEKMRLKAPVPLKTEVPTMGLHSNKNFVTTNAIQAILSKPKQMPEDFRFVTLLSCQQLCIHESCATCLRLDCTVSQPIITKFTCHHQTDLQHYAELAMAT